MISALAALVLLAAPLKTTGPGKALVGAWYQGDTQYLDLTDSGQGRLGMLEMTWKVTEPNVVASAAAHNSWARALSVAQTMSRARS